MAVAFAEPPAPRSSYLPPQARSFSAPSTQYGAPSQGRSNFGAQPRTNYGPPAQQGGRSNFGAQAQQPRTNYGAPAQQPSSNYGAPAQQPSSNYGPPSTSYGVPQAQDFNNFDSQRANSYQQAPSSAYGVPSGDSYNNNNNGYSNGGYEEPAKYEFQYDVQDEQAALDFGHKEQREGSVATGKYYVLLPDGRKQVRIKVINSLSKNSLFPPRLSTTSLTKTVTAQPSLMKILAVAHMITTLKATTAMLKLKATTTTLKALEDIKNQRFTTPNTQTLRT